jgi:thiol-disulfide isomerase/thioredoxin
MLFPWSAYSVQETQYTGRLDAELVADFPSIPIRLTAATDKEKSGIPGLSGGETVYAGEITMGGGTQPRIVEVFAIRSGDNKQYAYIDLNQDKKLSADEKVSLPSIVNVPLSGVMFKTYPVRLGFAPGRNDSKEPMLMQSLFALARGNVDIDGRSTLVQYTVAGSGDIDPTVGNLGIDSNGDGKIESPLIGSPEALMVRKESVVFRVGKRYVSTKSVDVKTGAITLRSHPPSDYIRIELTLGAEVPDFTFTDFEGRSRKLSDFRGKYVLLDFWGTWCGPCIAEIPHLKEAYEKYRERGFEILGMDREMDPNQTVDNVKKFLADKGVTWTQATSDSIKDLVTKRFRIAAYPTSVLLDPQGKILKLGLRGEGIVTTLDAILPNGSK